MTEYYLLIGGIYLYRRQMQNVHWGIFQSFRSSCSYLIVIIMWQLKYLRNKTYNNENMVYLINYPEHNSIHT